MIKFFLRKGEEVSNKEIEYYTKKCLTFYRELKVLEKIFERKGDSEELKNEVKYVLTQIEQLAVDMKKYKTNESDENVSEEEKEKVVTTSKENSLTSYEEELENE